MVFAPFIWCGIEKLVARSKSNQILCIHLKVPQERKVYVRFDRDRFLCRANSAELAGENIPLRTVIRARNQRRKKLRCMKKSLNDRTMGINLPLLSYSP